MPVIDLLLSPPVIGLVLVLALTTLYKIALPLKPPWYRGLPGAALAAVVFLAGATGLRLYLDWLTGTGYTYVTRKNRRNDPDRMVIRKYDPVARQHVEFREER